MQFAPLDSEEESMTGSAKQPDPRARSVAGEREPTPSTRLRCARGATVYPAGLEAWADQVTSKHAKAATARDA